MTRTNGTLSWLLSAFFDESREPCIDPPNQKPQTWRGIASAVVVVAIVTRGAVCQQDRKDLDWSGRQVVLHANNQRY